MNRQQRRAAAKAVPASLSPTAALQLGIANHQIGRLPEAELHYRQVLAVQHHNPDALHLIGAIYLQTNRVTQGVELIQRAIGLNDTNAEYFSNLGTGLRLLGRLNDAEEAYRHAVALDSSFAAAFHDYGNVLLVLNRPGEALDCFTRVIQIDPFHADAHNQRAKILQQIGRYEDALVTFAHALSLDPERPEVLLNRSATFDEMHRFEDAAVDLDAALAINPDYAEAHWNDGLHRLLLGDYSHGWQKNEWRWKCPALKLRDPGYSEPLWLGDEPVVGKTILLHSDQGLGDAIHFARYATMVAARGARAILYVEPPLKDVLNTIEGVAQCLCKDDPLPAFDMHCP